MSAELKKVVTYGRITKVDAAKGIVEGVAMDETPDRDGEIFDYASSKPYIENWSAAQAETTKAAGQAVSYGNIRGQHNPQITAGRVSEPIGFDDVNKAVHISTKIVDSTELEKCLEGVYTGFSVKGAVVGSKWRDGQFRRYTVDPIEISLVDVPCNPSATFTAVKADGSSEERHFKSSKFGDGECVEISGVRRFYGEDVEKFVERAVSTLVSKSAETPITKEKTMTPEEIAKAAAVDKMKAAHKAVGEISACVGGYCDHGDAAKCAEKVADAHKHIAAAFADSPEGESESEKAAKAKKEEAEESAKAKEKEKAKKKGKKPADDKDEDEEDEEDEGESEKAIKSLKAEIDALKALVEKSTSAPAERAKPVLHARVVTKEGETSKSAADEAKIDPNDPQRVEKALAATYREKPTLVSL
jgi:hypothetical protein